MRRSNATTLKDVARDAGVTAMVASVVLNGAVSSTRVSEKTRVRILDAAERLSYRRNEVALALSRSRMNTIGIVATIDRNDTNVYFLEVLNGILGAVTELDQSAKIFSVRDWKQEEARIISFCDGRIDGLILIGPDVSRTFPGVLASCAPFVAVHSNVPISEAPSVGVDDEVGAYNVTRHLIESGHRRIAHISGPPTFYGARMRVSGYGRALEEAGIPFDEDLVVPAIYSIEAGRRSAEEMLRRVPLGLWPTAVFCASDAIAYGFMDVVQARGIAVPQDLSVVGFDDTLLARMTFPRLTTVRQPFGDMGWRAVELLLSQIRADLEEGKSAGGAAEEDSHPYPAENTVAMREELFRTELVLRDTVGAPARRDIDETF